MSGHRISRVRIENVPPPATAQTGISSTKDKRMMENAR
jgi:hypothetical protein